MKLTYNGDMAELSKYEQRLIFPKKGAQKAFVEQCLTKASIGKIAHMCTCSERTIRDWRREKFSIPLTLAKRLQHELNVSFPLDSRVTTYREHLQSIAKLGGKATIEKYGQVPVNEGDRLSAWKNWWETEGSKTTKITQARTIKKPAYSEELAECVGILLGDGNISKYQVKVTLHAMDDKKYGEFIVKLFQKLFAVPVAVYPSKHAAVTNYVVSRTKLVQFCIDTLDLKKGNKSLQQIDIPVWIKSNPLYHKPCIRGLFDTDGSFFSHTYTVGSKKYSYTKATFTNNSQPLLDSLHVMLTEMGIKARRAKFDIWLDSKNSIQTYMRLIGSHNPKHLKKCR